MKLLDLFWAWCQGPKQEMQLQVQQKTLAEKPPPEYKFQSDLPDWRYGEIDENGNRFWMIDYHGHGFIKYVEYVPEWVKAIWPQQTRVPLLWGITKAHPMSLNIDTTMPCVGHHYIFGNFICPEQQPPDFALTQPQPNQLYGRQITTSREIQQLRNGAS
jgi:hypothetical protein